MSIYIPSLAGCQLILTLAEKYELFPAAEEPRKKRSFKAIIRLVVSLITLRFFLNMGFYFNLISGCIKGCLSIVCARDQKTIGDYNASQFEQDTKRHFALMIVDLAALTFKNYYYFFFALYPIELTKNLDKLRKIIYEEFTLDVGESPIVELNDSSQSPITKRGFFSNQIKV